MTDKIKQKATRLLKNLQFSADSHNVSLVGPEVGSGANQTKVLLLKQVEKQEEVIEVSKALEQITVRVSMEEFLRKFFDIYSSDAETLTKLLGFETEHEAYMKSKSESNEDYDWEVEHQKWLAERVSQFTIMKSMNAGELDSISKSAYLQILALQETLEPALESYINQKEKEMTELDIAKSVIAAKEAELTAQLDVVKSLNSEVEALKAEVAVFKAAEAKAEFEVFAAQLKGVVAEDKIESIAKSLFAQSKVDAEGTALVIETLKATKTQSTAAVEASGLLAEQSHAQTVDVEKARNEKLVAALNADATKAIR